MKFKFVNHTQTFSASHLPCRPLALEALALEALAFCVSSLIWLRTPLNFIKASSFAMCDSLG